MQNNEGSSEHIDESNLFGFEDKYGKYDMPQELKQFCDDLENKGMLNPYLWSLANVSFLQQADYQGTESVLYTQSSKDKNDPTETSTVLEALTNRLSGEAGMAHFIEARSDAIEELGKETILEIESYIGVDSQGVEAQDARPLLGVDKEMVKALAHYIQKEQGYKENET